MEKREDRASGPNGGRQAKRKYEPPRIVSQEVFETTALACMKVTGGGCNVSPKS